MQKSSVPAYANRILSRLSPSEREPLVEHLWPVALPLNKMLEAPNRAIDHVYFVEQGIVSVVGTGQGTAIEVGLIGQEGMTGVAVILGVNRTPHKAFVQAAGHGLQISTANLNRALDKSPALRRALLRYCHTFLVQTANTAFVNGSRKLDERLARWLLMAHDRLGQDELPLTHEFLGIMLGVRRAGVTVGLRHLEKKGLIATKRGLVTIRDRAGLETLAASAYGVPEVEYARVFAEGRTRSG